jgi:D-glycero-D-manno-heptose 1,7-bisphosphate phosphatase
MQYTTIFLDRDGVINRKRDDDYVKHWSEFEFLPGVKEALQMLTENNYRLIVVTNQRGVARGWMTEADVQDIHARMLAAIVPARIAAIYYCPHDQDQCDCRKPKTGLFRQAQRDFPDIDFARSVMIGDSASDVEAGAMLGCHTIYIGAADGVTTGQTVAPSLYEAVLAYLV